MCVAQALEALCVCVCARVCASARSNFASSLVRTNILFALHHAKSHEAGHEEDQEGDSIGDQGVSLPGGSPPQEGDSSTSAQGHEGAPEGLLFLLVRVARVRDPPLTYAIV